MRIEWLDCNETGECDLHLATNVDLIRDGIGINYEDGELVLRHGSITKRFHGAAVEHWGSLTDDDRALCAQMMGLGA